MSRRSESDRLNDEPGIRRNRKKRKRSDRELQASTPKSRRTGRRRLPIAMALLGLSLFFLPNLVGWLGLQQIVIDYGLSDFKGKVAASKVSMGWFQPVRLSGVTAIDHQGEPVFSVEHVQTTKSLLALLTSSDFGQINFVRPVVELNLRHDGSNLEEAIANYLVADEDNDPIVLPKLKIRVVEGKVHVASAMTDELWRIDQLDLDVQTSTAVAPLVLKANCRIASSVKGEAGRPEYGRVGQLDFSGQVDSGSPIFEFGLANFSLETQDVPVSLMGPFIERFGGPAQATGKLSGKIRGGYDRKAGSFALEADRLNMLQFGITAPDLIGTDKIAVASLTAQGKLEVTSTLVSANEFSLESDFGWIKANGSFDIDQMANLATQGELLDTPFQMDSEVDLAGLVRMLPTTLQLHDGLIVQSGVVSFQASSRKENDSRRLVVNVDTANLKARRGDREIHWAKPFRLVAAIQESNHQLAIENVECISEFLTIRGTASRHSGSLVAEGDVSKLMEKMGQFVDFEGARLEGVFNGKFGWQSTSSSQSSPPPSEFVDNPVQIDGNLEFTNPVIKFPNMPLWQQPQLSLTLNGVGKKSIDDQLQLSRGRVQIDVGSERLVAKLMEPVGDVFAAPAWNLQCRIKGTMAGWLDHLGNFADLGEIKTTGKLTLNCDASVSSKSLRFSNIEYEIQKFVLDGIGVKIREPKVSGTGAFVYDMLQGDISIPDMILSSSSISLRAQPLIVSLADRFRIDGNMAYRADLNRVAEWVPLSPDAESVYWFGSMEGTLQLVSSEKGIACRVQSTTSNFVATRQELIPAQLGRPGQMMTVSQPTRVWKELLREPTVLFSSDVLVGNDLTDIQFQNTLLKSSGIRVRGEGSLSELGKTMKVDFSGTWKPSWQRMNRALAASTGGNMQFHGKREHDFVIRGPLFQQSNQPGHSGPSLPWVSPSLQAAIGFGWDQGRVMGLPVGQSQFELNLQESVALLKTEGIPIAGGKVRFTPRIDMRNDNPQMTLSRTRVIDHVKLKPETARQWFKYVTPFFADATSARGVFTVDIDKAQIPILDPMKMDLQGSILLSDVVIGAGPITEQLMISVHKIQMLLNPGSSHRNPKVFLRLTDQAVPVIIRNGRMYHQNLEFSHKDIVIRTYGSVGIDQSIDLVAQIAIADDWIKGKPLLAGLRGRMIPIPITGTIKQPKLDLLAITEFTGNLAKEAVGNAFRLELNRQVTPKVDEYQNEFNNKLNNEFNKFQNKLFGK